MPISHGVSAKLNPTTARGSRKGVAVCGVALALLCTATSAMAKVYYVSPNGNDRADGTSTGSAWRTINFAFSNNSPVRAGDVVQVAAGTYRENVDIKKSGEPSLPITLRGMGEVIVKDPTPQEGTGQGVIDILDVRHLVVQNIGVEDSYYFGFMLRGVYDVTLQGVRTFRTGASGIIATPNRRTGVRSSNIRILDSDVERPCYIFNKPGQGGQEGISLSSVDGFEVAYTRVSGSGKEGIDAKVSSRNGSIHHNTVWDNSRVGIYVDGLGGNAYNISVYSNLVYRNAHGIIVGNEGRGHTEDVSVYNNVVHSNRGRGLGVADWGGGPDHDVHNVRFINNTVTKNGTGIHIDNPEASGVLIRNNIAYGNGTRKQIVINDVASYVEDRNVVTDPHFRNPGWNDFSLQTSSPAIDAGGTGGAPAVDFDGRRRPMGAAPDVGAFEVR